MTPSVTSRKQPSTVFGNSVVPAELTPLPLRERLAVIRQLGKLRVKEYLQFDARVIHRVASMIAGWTARVFMRTGRFDDAFHLLARFHRGAYSRRVADHAVHFVRAAIHNGDRRFTDLIENYAARTAETSDTANFFANPLCILKTTALVLRSAIADQKGVIVLKYNHMFPLFARFFNLEQIGKKYHIVLEPSWSGYCDPNILLYARHSSPVFVQAIEPYDIQFLNALSSNLTPIPTAANWWIDDRLFRPLPEVPKDFDAVMVAGWGEYKRHHRFFQALATLRQQGHKLQVLLLGYPAGWPKQIVERQIRYFGLSGQIDLRERVQYDDVNALLNRARFHVLWSRHEGFNRAIIEAMLAGLPCVLRTGFNYGYHYPYVNQQTGLFASEKRLPEILLDLTENYQGYQPREWVVANMSCKRAARILEETIATRTGEAMGRQSAPLAIKVNTLDTMRYFDERDAARFATDYEVLAQCRRARQ